jgi:peptidoglycan/LPS O-acetylase OafA/YrhL
MADVGKEKFSALNGLRGLAALTVAVFHAHPLIGYQMAPHGCKAKCWSTQAAAREAQ